MAANAAELSRGGGNDQGRAAEQRHGKRTTNKGGVHVSLLWGRGRGAAPYLFSPPENGQLQNSFRQRSGFACFRQRLRGNWGGAGQLRPLCGSILRNVRTHL